MKQAADAQPVVDREAIADEAPAPLAAWEQIAAAAAALEAKRLTTFADADLDEPKVRRRLAVFHPLMERSYFIATEGTNDFYELVYDHCFARKSGLYVAGEFRVGKTTAINNAIRRLADDLPWLAAFVYSGTRKASHTKDSFFREILRTWKYPIARFQSPSDVLVRLMMAAALRAGSRTCLLFVDEAQMLTVMQLRFLLELWNELAREKFVLVTILVGQTGLAGIDSLKQLVDEEDHGAVEARFFLKRYELGGFRKSGHLRAYLKAFDKQLAFPSPKWPYARFFLKTAFDAGWRLENETDILWGELTDYVGPSKKLASAGLRTAFVDDAIRSFLGDAMKSDSPVFTGTSELWRTAIESAADSDLFI